MKKSYLIMMIGSAISLNGIPSSNAALNCTQTPDCASLGYTMSAADCGDKVTVKCPTDASKVFCKTETSGGTAELPILYGDGTVSKTIISGKTPIGIVFDETNKLALALTDVEQSGAAGSEPMYWSFVDYDIPSLPNCEYNGDDASVDSCSVDGRSNTTWILNCGSRCGDTPVATAVNSYEPTGCTKDFCKKTKWFLPSMRDLAGMYSYKSQIDASLTLLQSQIEDSFLTLLRDSITVGLKDYWSSTEYNNYNAWKFRMNIGYGDPVNKYGSHGYVRPVIYYGEPKTEAPLPILYGDGTVSKEIISGKTPIGVVFDETNKLAVALTDVRQNGSAGSEGMPWSNNEYDITSLTNCQYSENDSSVDSCSVDGRSNTTLILNCGSSCGGTPTATAVNSYEPTGCTKDFCKKTKWFLPSMRDLANVYSYKSQIEASLTLLRDTGAVSLGTNRYYWSSTEYDGNYACIFGIYNGSRYWGSKNVNLYVRPVIYYGEPKTEASLPILYGDGTTSKEIISGKTPIGIVFDETNRLALALTDVKKSGAAGSEAMYWSNNYYDIPSLSNCRYEDNDPSVDSCSVDGRSNTTLILACGSGCGGTPAATAVNNYEPTGCTKDFCKKTKWFLPSMRDLAGMYSYKSQIEATLTTLNSFGAVSLGTKYYWSSIEATDIRAWGFGMDVGYKSYGNKNRNGYDVRPVVKY